MIDLFVVGAMIVLLVRTWEKFNGHNARSRWLAIRTIFREEGDPYLTRWFLTPAIRGRGRWMIHVIHRSDADKAYHDHPWDLWSMVLWGSYKEHKYVEINGKWVSGSEIRKPWQSMHLIKDTTRHMINLMSPFVVTLVYHGPRKHESFSFYPFAMPDKKIPMEEWFAQRDHWAHEYQELGGSI